MREIKNGIEATGENFSLEVYLEAQKLCISITDEIISRVEPGMTEKDGQTLIVEAYKRHGIRKFWHGSKFRIGKDTLKDFSEKPDESLVCTQGDICFVDLGPIINAHEADFGRTFIVGHGDQEYEGKENVKRLVQTNKLVFDQTAKAWRDQALTGKELLDFAESAANSYGYRLNPKMAGHRLGDFPHRVHSTTKLFSYDKTPAAHLWVLEIHLWDDSLERGAFYEDILI